MEKYQFKSDEGVDNATPKQIKELCELALKCGYELSSAPGSRYWNCCEPNVFFWSNGLEYFYNSRNKASIRRTFEEMKQLLSQHMRFEFPKDWAIYGSEEFDKLVKENVWFFGSNPLRLNLRLTSPYRYGMKKGDSELDYYSDRNITNTLVTIEQLTDYINSINPNKNKEVMKHEDEIVKIPMEFLAQGMVAMSTEQRAKFLPKINVVNGEVTVRAVRDCYENVCSEWKAKFEKLFPWLLEKDNSVNVVSMVNVNICSGTSGMLEIREGGEYNKKAFYLSDSFEWKLLRDEHHCLVLVPTTK